LLSLLFSLSYLTSQPPLQVCGMKPNEARTSLP
jgi:hypothetical protein